jgi:hypothetical protein
LARGITFNQLVEKIIRNSLKRWKNLDFSQHGLFCALYLATMPQLCQL